jgi:hypothetical protein
VNMAAFILSLFIAGVGALGIAAPSHLLGFVRRFESPPGLFISAAIRILLGVTLLFSAPASLYPWAIRFLGIIFLVVGLLTPLIGINRFRRLLDWWSSQGYVFIRIWAGFALVLGLFMAYAVMA